MFAIHGRWSTLRRTVSYPTLFLKNYSKSASTSLSELIKQRKFDEAHAQRQELFRRHTPVLFHPDFEQVLEHILTSESPKLSDFTEWLRMHPQAQSLHPDTIPYRGTVKLMLRDPQKYLPFLMEYAAVCSWKGFKRFVDVKLLPVIQANLNATEFETFMARLVLESSDQLPESIEQTSSVEQKSETEEEDDDSVADLYEPLDADYELLSNTGDDGRTETKSATAQITSHISENQLRKAYDLVRELKHSGFTIPHSEIFEIPAQAVVQDPSSVDSYAVDEGVTEKPSFVFGLWLSLLPDAIESRPRRFRTMQRLLLGSVKPDISLLMQFSLICSSKGYGFRMARWFLTPIFLYTSSDRFWPFLRDFLALNGKFWRDASKNGYDRRLADRERNHVLSYTLSKAIRTFVAQGERFDSAVNLVTILENHNASISLERPTPLTPRTYDVLLEALWRANKLHPGRYDEHIRTVEQAQQRLLDHMRRVNTKEDGGPDQQDLEAGPVQFTEWEYSLASRISGHDPRIDRRSLPDRLRFIKGALRHGHSIHSLPHPFTVVWFMQDCMLEGRANLLNLLRHHLLRTNPMGASLFLFSEMLLYYKQGLYDHLILVFVRHFYLVGVPGAPMQGRARFAAEKSTPSNGFYIFTPSQSQAIENDRSPLTPRLHPDPYIIALAWHGLVKTHRSIRERQALYNILLKICKGQPDNLGFSPFGHQQEAYQSSTPTLISPKKMDRAVFVPFIKPFMHAGGPNEGFRIIKDMVDAGIHPSIYHWTEVAGYLAKRKHPGKVFWILDQVEKQLDNDSDPLLTAGQSSDNEESLTKSSSVTGDTGQDRDESASANTSLLGNAPSSSPIFEDPYLTELLSPSSPNSSGEPLRFPPPDVTMYTSILRGFYLAGDYDNARLVLDRLFKVKDYQRGEIPALDQVIDDLESLRERKRIVETRKTSDKLGR